MNALEKETYAIAFAAMTPRQGVAVRMRFGLAGGRTKWREIGEELGVSKSRAMQICSNGLRRARFKLDAL